MRIPSHFCHKCQGFMRVYKIGDDYILMCPACEKKKEEDKE
jgi:DNA-directed RNA polymerase subunit M/transcription elongation factor TFIIS